MNSIFSTSKKGLISDLAQLLIVPFALAIIFVVISLTFDEINTAWQASDTATNTSKEIVSSNENKFVSVFDNAFLILFIGLILAGITGLFLLNTHPIIFIVSIIGIIVLVLVSGILANSFSDVTETGTISTYTQEFTYIPLIMENLLPTSIIVAGLFSVAFFAKIRLLT